jgi:hypothetical protein
MSKRDALREFLDLIKAVHEIGKARWLLRGVGLSRRLRLKKGTYLGTLLFRVTLMPLRGGFIVSLAHKHDAAEPGFRRLMKRLGYERIPPATSGTVYLRPCVPPIMDIAAEQERILKACRTGRVEDRGPRTVSSLMPRKRRLHLLEQNQGWKLVDWLRERSKEGWRPDLLFLRQEKRVQASGIRWVIDYDGYWEPPDRKGLELDLVLTSQRPLSPQTWERLKKTGFIEGIQRELQDLGLRPSLRPRLGTDDFDGKRPGFFLATFGRNVRKVDDAASAVRALLKWTPQASTSP